jgi:serine/threonine-protein kinase RsbW
VDTHQNYCERTTLMAERNKSPWREASLSSSAEVVPLLEQVLAAMVEHGYSSRSCFELRLALEEAIVNGLRHGNGGDPSKRVWLRYRACAEEVLVEVEDEGPGFDLTAVPDPTAVENLEKPSGRGLLLMRHCTSWVRYHERGNRVTLCKRRSSCPIR